MGGVISSFKFEGYKIDRITYESIPEVKFLQTMGTLDPSGWNINIGFREPLYIKSLKQYVGGMDIALTYPIPEQISPSELKPEDESPLKKTLVKLDIGIAGIFAVEENRLEKNTEETLVKIQVPMILFPYLRAAITSLFAHIGLGSFLFPLINIHELAKNANLIIREVD